MKFHDWIRQREEEAARKLNPAQPPIDPKRNVRKHGCCDRAVKRNCMCLASWDCPDHGSTCIGSHH